MKEDVPYPEDFQIRSVALTLVQDLAIVKLDDDVIKSRVIKHVHKFNQEHKQHCDYKPVLDYILKRKAAYTPRKRKKAK